jgi:hypothetical protein
VPKVAEEIFLCKVLFLSICFSIQREGETMAARELLTTSRLCVSVLFLAAMMNAQEKLPPSFVKEAGLAVEAVDGIEAIDTEYAKDVVIDSDAALAKAKQGYLRVRNELAIPEARKAIDEASHDAHSATEKHVIDILKNLLAAQVKTGLYLRTDYRLRASFDKKAQCQAELIYIFWGEKSLSEIGLAMAKENSCTK